MRSTKKRIALILLAVACAAEIGVRLSGILDFPTYLVDPELGYLLKPNQSGAFLNRNTWVFNDRSMPIGTNWDARAHPDLAHPDLLLIGNSIIMGGNPYAQPDKVAPLVQRELGDSVAVWPTAVGGWTQVNETAYLQRNPDIVGANAFFVWEVMSGGFSRLAPWAGDFVFPRERPVCGTCYVLRRYLLPRILALHESELPPVGQSDPQQVARFESMIARLCASSPPPVHGVLLLYPTQAELVQARRGVEWLPDRTVFERIAATYGLKIIDVAAQPGWDASKYRNDHTHPSVEGNVLLAHIIAAAIQSSFRPPR